MIYISNDRYVFNEFFPSVITSFNLVLKCFLKRNLKKEFIFQPQPERIYV